MISAKPRLTHALGAILLVCAAAMISYAPLAEAVTCKKCLTDGNRCYAEPRECQENADGSCKTFTQSTACDNEINFKEVAEAGRNQYVLEANCALGDMASCENNASGVCEAGELQPFICPGGSGTSTYNECFGN